MKKIPIIAIVALLAGAVSARVSVQPVEKGAQEIKWPSKILGVKAVSSTASGTITIKEVIDVAKSNSVSKTVTNITYQARETKKVDAYVGNNPVYVNGSTSTAWTKAITTNVVDGVTNVFTVSTLADGGFSYPISFTNAATSVKVRSSFASVPVTNIATVSSLAWSHKPYTNTLYSGTLSSGYLSADITNKYFLPGTKIIGDGTAFTGGNVYFIIDR